MKTWTWCRNIQNSLEPILQKSDELKMHGLLCHLWGTWYIYICIICFGHSILNKSGCCIQVVQVETLPVQFTQIVLESMKMALIYCNIKSGNVSLNTVITIYSHSSHVEILPCVQQKIKILSFLPRKWR